MARLHGEASDYKLNSVNIEDELNSIDLEITQDLQPVTAFDDAAEEFVEGKYGWTHEIAGSCDFAASQGDATIFGLVGAGEKASNFEPTGNTPNTNDPNYDGNVLLERYSISARVNAPVTYRASLRGNGALTRDVTP